MRTRSPQGGPPSDGAPVISLVVHAKPAIGNVVRCILGVDDPEHDDVLQSAVARLLAVMRAAPRRGRSVVQLAAVIARNVAVDVRRARSRWRRVLSHDEDALAAWETRADPERIAAARESLRLFAAALAGLRAENARVVYAHDVLGHELGEIAVMLGISVAAAQSRLVRGRGRIAVLLGRKDPSASHRAAKTERLSTLRAAERRPRSREPDAGRIRAPSAEPNR
ncbi:MAG TPA: sigma-70 family RNA polymerase sigma factor [Polyangiaceae bacterium]|jgi:RNA polymerase sigma factor (sigma-70 family)